MKNKWNKLWNPNNIDFKALEKMSKEELDAYVKELYAAEWAKLWVNITYALNCLAFNNTWQYIIVCWINLGWIKM